MSTADDQNDSTQPMGSKHDTTAPPRDQRVAFENTLLNGRYAIEKELGRGGIGVVYLAYDRQLFGKKVVVKLLLEQVEQEKWLRRKFQQEVEALARINHPGVVSVLDMGLNTEGKQYFVMEYVDGVSLRLILTTARLQFSKVSNIVLKIARTLDAVHKHEILHRDLKPENILLQNVDGEDSVKIIDFGIASIKNSQVAPLGSTSLVAGTPSYMAPEQLFGNALALSDLYALGVIAYEMLTGQLPFKFDSPYELYELQKAGIRARSTESATELPKAAQIVIAKALSFEPSDRYQSALSFGEALCRALALPVSASPPTNIPAQPNTLIGRDLEIARVGGMSLRKLLRHNRSDLTLVIGNGINRFGPAPITNSWQELLLTLARRRLGRNFKKIPTGVSLTEFYDLLALARSRESSIGSLQREICDLMDDWRPHDHHRYIASWARDAGVPILTTNFDRSLSDGLECKLYRTSGMKFTDFYPWDSYYAVDEPAEACGGFGVWHINGMEHYSRSVRLGLTHYMGSVEKARNWIYKGLYARRDSVRWPGVDTWLHAVFHKPLIIFGLALEENEVFLRWLLIERARYFSKYPDRRKSAWYVHRASERGSGKLFFLEELGIQPFEVESFEDIYGRNTWTSAPGSK
jgi:serine/threonine protein kinase